MAYQRIPPTKIVLNLLLAGVILSLSTLLFSASKSQTGEDASEPKLTSVFPLGGQRGTRVELKLRGESLNGAFGLWCDVPGLKGKIVKVEEVHDDFKPKVKESKKQHKPARVYQALIELDIQPNAGLGLHSLRLLSPRGVSNSVPFRVTRQPMEEVSRPHQTINEAQAVTFPVILNGRIPRPGNLDYYSFHAQKGDDLSFQVLLAENFEARLALYRPGGSWFDPQEPTRLLFEEERSSDLIPVQISGTYHVEEGGEYFLRVSGLYGVGCPDCSYQVRISPSKEADEFVPARMPVVFNKSGGGVEDKTSRSDWSERSFARLLESGWIGDLEARSVKPSVVATNTSAPDAAAGNGATATEVATKTDAPAVALRPPVLVEEREPNESSAQAQEVSIPAVIEGTIGHPGDVDSFKFSVKAGEKLAFEIETPDVQPPEFNPHIGVFDSQNNELFSNLFRRISLFNNNSDTVPYLQNVEPKALYTFEHGGEYVLQVRDITSRYGGPNYRYRILIRPQIPHVGEVVIAQGDHINLARGEAKTLTLTTSYEEGFSGSVSFTFKGLPQGVQALPGARLDTDKGPADADLNAEIVAPKYQKTTIVLLAESQTPLTSGVALVQVRCHPIVAGKPGPSFLAAKIPLSIVKPAKITPSDDHARE